MNVQELQAALQQAVDRGLPPTTTVVINSDDHGYLILKGVNDPSDGTGDYDMWFTLHPSTDEADCRFTEGGMSPEWYEARETQDQL